VPVPPAERQDLGAHFARITRRLVDAEAPILSAHGLTMWQYVVLSRLSRGDAPTQLALADDIRHDKTRLIPLLDELEAAGLITRDRDPTDRRARVVALTAAGRRRVAATKAAIRAMEDELLAELSQRDRQALWRVLSRL
jgi:DNA-binding MarR family transcriptional regulator